MPKRILERISDMTPKAVHLKNLARTLIGAENGWRLQRIVFPILHPSEYTLARRQFDVVFFCDADYRWQTIMPVVEELSRRREDLSLGLAFKGPREGFPHRLPNSKNVSTIAHVTIGVLRTLNTRIVYTTAFNMSSLTKPPKARVVHSFISMLSDQFYDHSFDALDYILCAGIHQMETMKKLACRNPAVSGKILIPAGYPKLDLMLASQSVSKHSARQSPRISTVVYAPTHSLSFPKYASAIVGGLLGEGHRVIFRPHPLSWIAQRSPIDQVCKLFGNDANFQVDSSVDYTRSYSLSDLMVTDQSGTGFTFSFSFNKPAIFFITGDDRYGQTAIENRARRQIGGIVHNVAEVLRKTAELCRQDMTREIEQCRNEMIFNVGRSAAYIVDCLEDILSERGRSEWVRL